mgnify:CR=1 FL=1
MIKHKYWSVFLILITVLPVLQAKAEVDHENLRYLSGIYHESWAIIIGINEYENMKDLKYAVNDAVDVDVRLSSDSDSASVAYVFSSSNLGEPIGVGIFPGSVWDVSDIENPRRLNICFFESDSIDLVWNPTDITGMDLEYLLIMDSDYDPTGEYYANIDITNSDVHFTVHLLVKKNFRISKSEVEIFFVFH